MSQITKSVHGAGQQQPDMAHTGSEEGEEQLKGVSEEMDLLQIDVETEEVEDRPGREASVSVVT